MTDMSNETHMTTSAFAKRRFPRTLAPIIAWALVVAAALSGPTTARASSNLFRDSFEGNPSDRWEGDSAQDGRFGFDIDKNTARSGKNNGWIYADHGWAHERIAVHLGGSGPRTRCTATVFMEPLGGSAQVGLQVWDPNGWHVISETYPLIEGDHYSAVSSPWLDLSAFDTVYVQAIYGNHGGPAKYIRLDDMTLECGG